MDGALIYCYYIHWLLTRLQWLFNLSCREFVSFIFIVFVSRCSGMFSICLSVEVNVLSPHPKRTACWGIQKCHKCMCICVYPCPLRWTGYGLQRIPEKVYVCCALLVPGYACCLILKYLSVWHLTVVLIIRCPGLHWCFWSFSRCMHLECLSGMRHV